MRAKSFLFIILIVVFGGLNSGCAIYHHYGSYYGQVIDAETREPLEGAVVLADYGLVIYGSPGGSRGAFLDAQETATDKNGEFKIPSLNSFTFRPFALFDEQPSFTIFKPRYECYTASGNYTLPENRHVTIDLMMLKTRKERIANTNCDPISVPRRKMKKFIKALNIEHIALGLDPYSIGD
jgi:hypothetical protein